MDVAFKEQKKTLAGIQKDAKLASNTVMELSTDFQTARSENNNLRKKLAKHDIGYLSERKPQLMQKIINKGINFAGRCFEILSGSPLTDSEKTANKPSQINTSCPDIANPQYKKINK